MPDMPMATPVKMDPHSILQEIADIDAHVAEKQHYRRNLVSQYHELMTGYEKHYNEVCNRPEPDRGEESVMAGPTPEFGFGRRY